MLVRQQSNDLKRLAVDGFDANGQVLVPDCVRLALHPPVGQIDAFDDAIGAIAPLDCQRSDPNRPAEALVAVKNPCGIIPFRWAASSRPARPACLPSIQPELCRSR
jgi:hypothetical protein